MKMSKPAQSLRVLAFTLIELLVVIAIIATLAALLLPALSKVKLQTQRKLAQTEMVNLANGIRQYYSEYSRLPASSAAVKAASTAPQNSNDFTFGTTMTNAGAAHNLQGIVPNLPAISTAGETIYQNLNWEIMAILQDISIDPESNATSFHIYNPQKTQFFNGKMATSNPDFTGAPGIGGDYAFRDPWGSPYIITEDLNYDNQCYDAVMNTLSSNGGGTTAYFVPGEVMIWSLGQLKTFNPLEGFKGATNKQTLLYSWQ